MSWYKPWTWADESQSTVEQRGDVRNQAGMSSWVADQADARSQALGAEAQARRDYLRRIASGQDSVSSEQLRQGLQQNVAAQRSMAASAPPSQSGMAARTAAIQSARLGSGMAGQQAVAGLQERQAAERSLADMILQQRGQEVQTMLGSRQQAIAGYGGYTPEGSTLDKWGNAATGVASIVAKSDRRAKTDIKDGDKAANRALDGLKAFTYRYKDERDGKGKQMGPMAQDLESAGLKHAVIDTPDGKMVHGAKLALSATALVSALANRVKKLEGAK